LVAMLLTGIRSARNAIQSAACMSNLKQLGQVVRMYVQDDRLGRFPGWLGSFQDFKMIMPLLYPYLSDQSVITGYDKRLEIFRCPSNTNQQWAASRIDAYGNKTDYEFNGEIMGTVAIELVAIPEWVSLFYDWPVSPVAPVKNIHRGGSNIVFYDGHVKWFSRSQMMEPHAPIPSTREYYNWGLY
ncbi:MAG: hypothetical protein Q8Q33_00475, partial [Chlamydiota bacterium]|nr:hypothetical protein [Chlamydiota bacterium]